MNNKIEHQQNFFFDYQERKKRPKKERIEWINKICPQSMFNKTDLNVCECV